MTLPLASRLHLVLAGGGHAVLWIAGGVVAIALLLALSRYELRLVSRRAGLALLGLRLLAILVLVAALFEPSAERRYEETVRGRVILGIDLSESMATADPVAAAGDKQSSRSEPIPTIPRRQVVRGLLEGPWYKQIAADHTVESVGFARDAMPGTVDTLAQALNGAPAAPGRWALVTDWSGVLAQALQGGESAPIVGVVLLTDGRQNAPGDPGRSLDRLTALGIPIYSVLIGSTTAPKDVAIASVTAPETVLKGDIASVVVAVKADGTSGVDVPIVLEQAGGRAQRQVVRGTADGARPVVTFRVPMATLGVQGLTVKVGPLFGDARPDNDHRTVTIQVADDKARVLLIDGEARWEFRYLYNALKRDPRVDVEAILFRQPSFSASIETYKKALPQLQGTGKVDPLGGQDAIFVGDVDPGQMTGEAWSRLESFVSRRGGTLVLSAGPRAWPTAMLSVEAARNLLPVLEPKVVALSPQAVDPSHPSLAPGVTVMPATVAAGSWPMLELGATPESSRSAWEGLPHLPWALAGRAKPGATTLATVEGPGPADTRAVIAAQRYGLGKVLWVGTDATWRWRFRAGDTFHHRFWGQVVRWAAAGKLAAGDAKVRFGPDRSRLPEGEGPRLTARFADGIAGVGPDLPVVARIFKAATSRDELPRPEGEAMAIVPLRPILGQPRTFGAIAPALAAGRYLVRLDAGQASGNLTSAPEAAYEVAPRETSELVELSAARDPLERLAAATGGRVFTTTNADQLPGALRARTIVRTRTEETTLWDRPWALGAFFGILTFEWMLRKRVGLP